MKTGWVTQWSGFRIALASVCAPFFVFVFRQEHFWVRNFDCVLNDADQGYPYLKRFTFEPTTKPQRYLGENENSTLILLSDTAGLRVEVAYAGADSVRPPLEVVAREFVAVKSLRAKGKRLTTYEVASITEIEPREKTEPENMAEMQSDDDDGLENENEPNAQSDDEVRDELTGQQRIF